MLKLHSNQLTQAFQLPLLRPLRWFPRRHDTPPNILQHPTSLAP
jgi:hypothetical protein